MQFSIPRLCVALMLIATVFWIAAVAAPDWTHADAIVGTVRIGLFTQCIPDGTGISCKSITDKGLYDCAAGTGRSEGEPDQRKQYCQIQVAAQAFAIITILLSVSALYMTGSNVKDQGKSSFTAALLCLIAAVFGIITFALCYESLYKQYHDVTSNYTIAACMPLAIIAWVFSLLSGVLLLVKGNEYATIA